MKNKVYTVRAVRFSGTHSYVVGVYSKKAKAMKAADVEEEWRGGNKYSCEILEWSVDEGMDGRHFKPKRIRDSEFEY